MADIDAALKQTQEHVEHAEGFITDAEFREEHEERVIRYQQAMSHLLMGIVLQNNAIIDLLREKK